MFCTLARSSITGGTFLKNALRLQEAPKGLYLDRLNFIAGARQQEATFESHTVTTFCTSHTEKILCNMYRLSVQLPFFSAFVAEDAVKTMHQIGPLREDLSCWNMDEAAEAAWGSTSSDNLSPRAQLHSDPNPIPRGALALRARLAHGFKSVIQRVLGISKAPTMLTSLQRQTG